MEESFRYRSEKSIFQAFKSVDAPELECTVVIRVLQVKIPVNNIKLFKMLELIE